MRKRPIQTDSVSSRTSGCLRPYRGRRIATRLLDALSERLCRPGVQRIRLNVLAANRIARAAYEHAGFTPYEVVYEKVVGADGAQI